MPEEKKARGAVMKRIYFSDGWTPIPNSEIDILCRNRDVPAKVRVKWAIIRIIIGFDKNRPNKAASISYTALTNKTNASSRTVKRIVKQLEGEGRIQVDRGHGRGHRNIYSIDFDGLNFESKGTNGAKSGNLPEQYTDFSDYDDI